MNGDYARCTSENQSKYNQTSMAQKQKYLRYSQEKDGIEKYIFIELDTAFTVTKSDILRGPR